MLPDPNYSPAGVVKHFIHPFVAGAIAGDFRGPEFGVCLGDGVVLRASMPKTSVYEDGDPGAGENKVGSQASLIRQWREVDSVAQPCGMDEAPNGELGLGVPSPVREHACPDTGTGRPTLRHEVILA